MPRFVSFRAEDVRKLSPNLENAADDELAPFLEAAYEGFTGGRGGYRKLCNEMTRTASGGSYTIEIDLPDREVTALKKYIRKNRASLKERAAGIIRKQLKGLY